MVTIRLTAIGMKSIEVFDYQLLKEAVKDSDLEYLQLSRGALHGQLVGQLAGDSAIDSGVYSQDVLVRGSFSRTHITLAFVQAADRAGCLNGMRLGLNGLVVFTEGGPMDSYILPAGTRWVTCQVTRDQLESRDISIPERGQVRRYPGLASVGMRLSYSLASMLPRLEGVHGGTESKPPIDVEDMVEAFVTAFCQTSDALSGVYYQRFSIKGRQRIRILRRLEEFVSQNLDRKLRIGDLLKVAGISQRSLEYLYKDHYGITPQRYLALRRLHSFREHLLRPREPQQTISSIAASYGLTHPGRLSKEYRDIFGELPSQTASGPDHPGLQ